MSTLDYVSSGNPSQQKPPIGAPTRPALCLDTQDTALFAAINGTWKLVGQGSLAPSGNIRSVQLTADGVTDNLPIVNAALAALPSTGGIIQLIPVGTGFCYFSGPIVIAVNGVIMRGTSGSNHQTIEGNTVLQFAAGSSGIKVQANCVHIQDLTVLSKDTGANAADNGIWATGGAVRLQLEDVTVRNFGGVGILLDSSSGGFSDLFRFDGVLADSNFGDGLAVQGGSDGNIGVVIGCEFHLNGGWGINLISGSTNGYFLSPYISQNTAGGIQVATVSNYFENVYIDGGTGSSFVTTSTGSQNSVRFAQVALPSTITDGGTGNTIRTFAGNQPVTKVSGAIQPTVVFSQTITGLVASDAAHETVFTPVAGHAYRTTAIVSCTATGAGGSTMSVQVLSAAGNVNAGTAASHTVPNTTLGMASAAFGGAFAVNTGDTMGWLTTLAGSIGTATYQVDFIVEQLY